MIQGGRDYDAFVDGTEGGPTEPAGATDFRWVERAAGVAQLRGRGDARTVVIEGSGSDWFVTLRGRRIAVSVRSWRERMLAAAALGTDAGGGPMDVTATLPGLVVTVEASAGMTVAAGDPLLTIEAMKMQNEVRAPRPGRIGRVAVEAGQTVGKGQLLLRLE